MSTGTATMADRPDHFATDAPTTGGPTGIDRRERVRDLALLGLFCLTLNLAGNGHISLWDRDEPRYATCTREMMQSGDWIHPTFNGEPRYHKPVLIYWLMMAGTSIGGDNPFGARLVSGVAGMLACLVTYLLASRLFNVRTARFASIVMATAPLVVVESKLATTDATLSLLILGAQFCLWELRRRSSTGLALLFWTIMGLSVLVKGPVGPAFIGTAALASWIFGAPPLYLKRLRYRWGIPLFLAITVPWFVAIGVITQGAFYEVALGYHVVERVTRGIEEHGGFPGYYIILTLGTFYPWSSLAPASMLSAWKARRGRPEIGFLLGWIVGPLLMLEMIQTKLIHYYLPAMPALALLVGWFLDRLTLQARDLRQISLGRLATGLLTGIGLTGVAALIAGAIAFEWMRLPGLVLAVVVLGGTLGSLTLYRLGQTAEATWSLAATWAMVLLGLSLWLLPAADPHRISDRVGKRLKQLAETHEAEPALARFDEPGIIYGLGRPAAVVRRKATFYDAVRRDGAIVIPLSEEEIAMIHAWPEMSLEVVETISGYNLDKARTERLQMAVVRWVETEATRDPSESLASDSSGTDRVASDPETSPIPRVAESSTRKQIGVE